MALAFKLVRPSEAARLAQGGVGFVLIISVALALLGYYVPAYLLPLVGLALVLLFRREVSTNTAYLNLLTFTGLLLLLGVEFFFLRDFLGGDAYRMNTLFKFYIQVWVIFGLASATGLAHLWQWSESGSPVGRLLWRTSFAL